LLRSFQIDTDTNATAFNLNTEESSCWLKFFMADVSISEIKTHANGGKTPYVVLKLQIRDLEHLKKLRLSWQAIQLVFILIREAEFLID
jgi:hypothetical protein